MYPACFRNSFFEYSPANEHEQRCDGPDQFQKFDQLLRAVIAAPRSRIVEREAEGKKARAKKKTKQG